MRERINILQRLLERFKFFKPISLGIQRYILSTKKGVLMATLKSVGVYSFFYGLVLGIFFRARRMGFSLSVAQSAFVLGIISTIIACAITVGAALSIQSLSSVETEKKVIGPERVENKTETREKTNKVIQGIRYRMGIQPFTGENVDSVTMKMITNRIAHRLIVLKGENRVIRMSSGKRPKNVNLILMGFVGKMGDIYMISARVIDVETARAVFMTSENFTSENEINTACDRIAGNVAGRIKQ